MANNGKQAEETKVDWLKNGLEYLVGIGKHTERVIEVDGLKYGIDDDGCLDLIRPPVLGPDSQLMFRTLSGFCDYCNLLMNDKNLLIHVESPWRVALKGKLDATYRTRETLAAAFRREECGIDFGKQYDPETFVILMQTLFDETSDARPNDRPQLLALVGNMSQESAVTTSDDGFSQSVGLKANVSLKDRAMIQNPFNLAPKRTFPEIEQPISPFVLRIHRGAEPNAFPKPALYQCDNQSWQIECVQNLAEWISAKITSGIEVLA